MPTIKDVAREAGVSVGTVSMVLNGSSSVKMETRVHVLQVIEKMGYTPNQYARSLVTKKRNIIGIIRSFLTREEDAYRSGYHFEELPDTYLADMLDVIVGETTRLGYSLLLDVANQGSGTESSLPMITQPGRIDGLIWASGFMTQRQKELLMQLTVPIVTIGSRFDCFDYVDTDPVQGMYDITRYVLSCGHRDIVFINGLNRTQTSERKLEGVKKAYQEFGIPYDPQRTEEAPFSGLGGYNAMKRLWMKGNRPTAVLTALDVLAMGAMRFLEEEGLRIPDNVSVTGYEDGILAEYCNPRLTTVCSKKSELGLQASRTLVNRINNPNAQRVKLIIQPELVIRETVRNIT